MRRCETSEGQACFCTSREVDLGSRYMVGTSVGIPGRKFDARLICVPTLSAVFRLDLQQNLRDLASPTTPDSAAGRTPFQPYPSYIYSTS